MDGVVCARQAGGYCVWRGIIGKIDFLEMEIIGRSQEGVDWPGWEDEFPGNVGGSVYLGDDLAGRRFCWLRSFREKVGSWKRRRYRETE